MDTFAAFRSRSDALRLIAALREKRLAATAINTPRRQGLSCGLSVLFSGAYRAEVDTLIRAMALKSFYGFYNK